MAEDWRSDLEVWLAPFLAALRHKTRMRVCPCPGPIGGGAQPAACPPAAVRVSAPTRLPLSSPSLDTDASALAFGATICRRRASYRAGGLHCDDRRRKLLDHGTVRLGQHEVGAGGDVLSAEHALLLYGSHHSSTEAALFSRKHSLTRGSETTREMWRFNTWLCQPKHKVIASITRLVSVTSRIAIVSTPAARTG